MKTGKKISVLGVDFDSITLQEAADSAAAALYGDCARYVVTPNPEIVELCRKDAELCRIVNDAYLVLPDGIGIVYGAKILGTPIAGRVPGIAFIEAVFDKIKGTDRTVFLLGAAPGVAEAAKEKLEAKYEGLKIVGVHDGYFDDDEQVLRIVNSCSPDLLVVCLGAPKQEKLMAKWRGSVDCRLMAGLGGCLDVFSGKVQRAPEIWQKLGMEWLYRAVRDPKRIKRIIKLPLFIFAAIGQRFGGKR